MQNIQVLPDHISNLIAAGEVVDRPASVIKELVENAVDAGATEIVVEIKRGGNVLMRVTDNGSGMSRENAERCLLRHATSKIATEQDLERIQTLGFRGEALAAISAVSKLTMLTRPEGSVAGTQIVAVGGQVSEISDCGSPKGTTVLVQELFFNTPARQKFLKKDATEAATIGGILEKLAISMPHVGLQYIKDGKICMRTLGNGDLRGTLYSATGADYATDACLLAYAVDGISVSGLICRPEQARPNRGGQAFFVNGRYVRSRTLQTALEEAYAGAIPTGKYPAGALFLQLDAAAVDANVHPQKMEVKFSSEGTAYGVVYHGVKTALQKAGHKALSFGNQSTADFFTHVTAKEFGKIAATTLIAPKGAAKILEDLSGKKTEGSSPSTIKNAAPLLAEESAAEAPTPLEQAAVEHLLPAQNGSAHESVPVLQANQREREGQMERDVREALGREPIITATMGLSKAAAQALPTPNALHASAPAYHANLDVAPMDWGYKGPIRRMDNVSDFIRLAAAASVVETAPATLADGPLESQSTFFAEEEQLLAAPEFAAKAVRAIGEAFGTYVLAEVDGELWLIDKHAARERIIFEELKKNHEVTSQKLLSPQVVVLGRPFVAMVEEQGASFEQMGFELDIFGDNAVLVRSVPMQVQDYESLLLELCELLEAGKRVLTPKLYEEALHRIACKAAVKGNSFEAHGALQALVAELCGLPDIRHCPHGRPVVTVLTKTQLERQFGRQ